MVPSGRGWESEAMAATVAVVATLVAFGAAIDGYFLQGSGMDLGLGAVGAVTLPLFWALGFPVVCVLVVTTIARRRGWAHANPGFVIGGTFTGEMAGLHVVSLGGASWMPYWTLTAALTFATFLAVHVVNPQVSLSGPAAGLHLGVLTALFAPLFLLALLPVPGLVPTFVTFLAVAYLLAATAVIAKGLLSRFEPAAYADKA